MLDVREAGSRVVIYQCIVRCPRWIDSGNVLHLSEEILKWSLTRQTLTCQVARVTLYIDIPILPTCVHRQFFVREKEVFN